MHNAFLDVKPALVEWRQFDPEKKLWLIPENIESIDTRLYTKHQLAPYSPAFSDIYFNPEDGVAESNHVFLEGNKLPQRFQECHQSHNAKTFTIFETGFGTGLNFLLAAKLWQDIQTEATEEGTSNKLDYYSVEQFPISPNDLQTIHQVLGIESPLSTQLTDNYPPPMPGIYSVKVSDSITLHLIFYPLDMALKEIGVNQDFAVDAWFLDGFAPSKNPEMWNKSLLHFMTLYSSQGSTLATFTVAAAIRKQLPFYGFEISKQPGFGRKREMLTATFTNKELSKPKTTLASAYLKPRPPAGRVAIIGAGLSGCSLAYQLQRNGLEPHIFEANDSICAGASNMPSLVASPALSIDHNAYSQLTFLAFERLFAFTQQNPDLSSASSAHQLTSQKYSQQHLNQYQETYRNHSWADCSDLFEFESVTINNKQFTGLKMPAVQVNGQEFCRTLVKDIPSKNIHLSCTIKSLDELKEFDHVVFCTGFQVPEISSESLPRISPMRGQLTTLNASLNHQAPINHDGHLAHYHDQLVVGATFESSDENDIKRENSLTNIEKANQRFGFEFSEKDIIGEYPGVRATSYDRFPFCGELSTIGSQTIWLNYGFGARGLCFSILCAEVITKALKGDTLPLPKTLLKRISPRRSKP